jgi:hypothetical protein
MTTSQRRRLPSRRFKAAFKAERPTTGIPLGMAVADGTVLAHSFNGYEGWMQPLTDDIEPCSCGAFFSPVHYREKEGIKRETDALFSDETTTVTTPDR